MTNAYVSIAMGTSANHESKAYALTKGSVVIVAGPNGVGKSALLDEFAAQLGTQAESFAGHRQISFQNDDIDQVGQSLETFAAQLQSNRQHANRYRNPWGEQHLKSVVRRIMNTHAQSSEQVIEGVRSGKTLEDAEKEHPRLLDVINHVFMAARMPISITLDNGSIRAKRGQDTFTIDRLSDGERAAVLLVGAVLVQPIGGYIIVDEPERHLRVCVGTQFERASRRVRSMAEAA